MSRATELLRRLSHFGEPVVNEQDPREQGVQRDSMTVNNNNDDDDANAALLQQKVQQDHRYYGDGDTNDNNDNYRGDSGRGNPRDNSNKGVFSQDPAEPLGRRGLSRAADMQQQMIDPSSPFSKDSHNPDGSLKVSQGDQAINDRKRFAVVNKQRRR